MVRDSFELARYEPAGEAVWQRRYNAFRELLG
jgi:hypothetical protein